MTGPPTDPPSAPETTGGAPGRPPRRRGRRLLKGLGLLVVSLLVAAVVGELVYRASGREPLPDIIGPRYLFERDDELGIRLRPGFRGTHETHEFEVDVAVNALGLRDREVDEIDPAALRILSLGDSFAYGFGVRGEETYSRRLEEVLAQNRPVRVFNAGAPSYGTRHELMLLRRLLPELAPDLVVVSFFFGNDLQDNIAPLLTERGGVVLSGHYADLVDSSGTYSFALEHSDLLTVGILRWMQLKYGYDVPASPTRPPPDPVAVFETPVALEVLAREASPELDASWQATVAILGELRDATRGAGAKLALVHVPLQYLFDDELWARMCARHEIIAEDFDRGASARRLGELAGELGVPYLDLAKALGEETDTDALYFPVNKHFTAAGHDVAGRALAAFLVGEKLLDE